MKATSANLLSLLLLLLPCLATAADSNHPSALRIGTGGSSGTYFPVGSLIAKGLNARIENSNLPDRAGKDLVLVPQRSNGSVSNVEDMSCLLYTSDAADVCSV